MIPSRIAHSSDSVIVANEGDQQRPALPRLFVPDAGNLAAVDQSPCNEEQQRRDHRERQITRQRRNEKQNGDQKDRREDRSERCSRTGYDIDARAIERTAGRIRREKRACNIREPLADELLIAVELVAVPHGERARDRHRFSQREQCHHHRCAEQHAHRVERQIGHR